ncbi:MAG TPA: CerR family C-terminal domain-containing protein [Hypericibacter adhaerens]|jgi:AcrR family transcriptional regulator|uniref:Putative transcriptional regulator, TetR n=1 Tax=Hypericibacter adhaerens TaxID=2602016 RepID=A0A5J6N1J6_9PROT|nr:CerR family C-terminal domain-containing protein [Hypericibacter adhaerens]QEX22825.1 putative transcriptional regulator, TetR [Hypericibacter adhaerens]HWA44974.1 CerR family C-terminal domain-containing protein [Hypericibacter adhaerens]
MPRRAVAAAATESSRGDPTRQRLLEAGLRLFGKHGFDGVSTRELAKAAGVNLAAIPYHFGGKEGVYLAVVDQLASTVEKPLSAMVAEIEAAFDRARGRAEIEALLARLIGTLARILLGSDQQALRIRFMMREQLQPTAAFERLYARFIEHVHRCLTRLVARLLDADPETPQAILRAHALFGQILAFAMAQATIRRRMGWKGEYSAAQIDEIVGIIVEMTLASLRSGPRAAASSSRNPS